MSQRVETIEPTYEGDFSFAEDVPFRLAAGGTLQPVRLRYCLYGELNRGRTNAVLVPHALSGSARVADWWQEMFGANRPFDITRRCIIGINAIGSCYGSTGPTSINPHTSKPYAGCFPIISIGDIVRAQAALIESLGIKRLHTVIGGSIGGMQALQWACDFPERVEQCIAVGATPLSAIGLAFNHLQRQAITNDPAWSGGDYAEDTLPEAGLALARAIAMCTYKSAELFTARFGRRPNRAGENPYRALAERFDVAGYLDYQGSIFTNRFDANSYLVLSKAMDTFDFTEGERCMEDARLRRIQARVLLIGVTSDWLFPAADVRELADRMQHCGVAARYVELVSEHGHDAFLADAGALARIIMAEERKDSLVGSSVH